MGSGLTPCWSISTQSSSEIKSSGEPWSKVVSVLRAHFQTRKHWGRECSVGVISMKKVDV